MTLRHLKIFLAIYETGSTVSASEALRIAQPAVSVALKELEEHYGVKMFERFSRRLHVTEAGEELYQYAKHLVGLFEETEDVMKSMGAAGTLHIGSSITIGNHFLTGYIRKLYAQCPGVGVRVTIENTGTIEQLLLENKIDLALVEGKVSSPFITVIPYRKDRLVTVCAPDHPFARKKRAGPGELAAESLLLREKGSSVRELFDAQMERAGCPVIPAWQSVSTQALVRAVKENMGVSVLPYYLVKEELERGELVSIPVEGIDYDREFSIIYHKNKYHSTAFDAFVEICRRTEEEALMRQTAVPRSGPQPEQPPHQSF